MEWYFASGIDDLVVPEDREPLEMIASPASWLEWGITAFGGPEFPKQNCYSAVDMNNCAHEEREHSNNNPSMFHGLCTGSLLRTTDPHEQENYQFTADQARVNHMDDIFFTALFEEDSTDHLNGSSRYSAESRQNTIPSLAQSMRSSRYLKTHAFSPSVDFENGEVSSSSPPVKEDSLNVCMREESSLEELVLEELEGVTAQFTEKTRICFRDALYRLAEKSKQTVSIQDGDVVMEPILTSADQTLRKRKANLVTEVRTNAIDRAMANLMFININEDDEDNETKEQQRHYSMCRQQISCCHHLTNRAGDAEVPFARQQNSPPPTANLLY